jgi:hypothetical protein
VLHWQKGFATGWEVNRRFKKQRSPTFSTRPRISSDVTAQREIERIWKSYRLNGGRLTYDQIEAKFNLKPNKGMNAYRICRKCHLDRNRISRKLGAAPSFRRKRR